jgi:hypothetical protein
MFYLQGFLQMTFMDLDIVDAYGYGFYGGAFFVTNSAQLTLINVALSGHYCSGGGGAIYYVSDHPDGLIVTNCIFIECTISGSNGGGAILVGSSARKFFLSMICPSATR